MWNKFRKVEIKKLINREMFNLEPFSDIHRYILYHKYDPITCDLLENLKNDDYMDDRFWMNLFCVIRDHGCKDIDINAKLKVNCSGRMINMSLSEAESHVIKDYGDICNTQIAIPEIFVKEIAKEDLKKGLQAEFNRRTQGKPDQDKEKCKTFVAFSSLCDKLPTASGEDMSFP